MVKITDERSDLVNKFEKILKKHKVWFYYPSERIFDDRKYPTMIATHKGRFFAFELLPKYETKDVVSWDCIDDFKKTGAIAEVVRHDNLKEIESMFINLKEFNQHDELES